MSDVQTDNNEIVTLTVDIVSAYVSNNHVQPAELAKLISEVHGALIGLGTPSTPAEESLAKASPSEVRRSIHPDYLVSFEDGKQYKTLRRHLTLRGLTPEQYRTKWGLAVDYPMTSAKYSEQRSELARALGLGQQRRKGAAAAPAQVESAPVETATAAPAEAESAPKTETSPKTGKGRPRKAG